MNETKKLRDCTIGELARLCEASDCGKCPIQYLAIDQSNHKICAAALSASRHESLLDEEIEIHE